MTNGNVQNGRSVAEVLHEAKDEMKEFLATRIQMLRSEMDEKIGAWKSAVPFIAIGILLLFAALMVFTAGLVALIAMAFHGQPWAVAVSCFIVMAIYALLGGLLAAQGWRSAKEPGLVPERTLNVLKQDQMWLQTEAKTQL